MVDVGTVSGDCNSDGILDSKDLGMLQGYLLGSSELADWQAADLCEDGVIDVYDMILLRRLYAEQCLWVK